jgi:hypothetical protein
MQDFRSFVGIRSREHVEFEEIIALRTSRVVAGRKLERGGGGGTVEGGGLRFRSNHLTIQNK